MIQPRPARGFTLIELMMVVAITGLLASVALPVFQKLLLRAKVTERASMTLKIKQSIQDYYLRNGTLLPASYGGTLASGFNPPFPPTTTKRVMSRTVGEWNVYFSGAGSVIEEIEGACYYSYGFQLEEATDDAPARITIVAVGDLDGDAVYSYKTLRWEGRNGSYPLVYEYPGEGLEDDHGPNLTF